MDKVNGLLLISMRSGNYKCTRRERGFTLIELMFTAVILVVLLSLGAPMLRNLVLDQRVKTAASDVHAALIFARSEAIKRNTFVGVCAKNDSGTGCQNSSDWARGWIVYIDTDGNGFPGAVSDLLRRQDAITDVTVTGTNGNVSYQGDGRLRVTPTTFVLNYPGNNDVTARCVRLDVSGRPNVQIDTNKDSSDGCQ
jgi:type IV fimbrial biogenesis protein FimT